MKFIGVIPARYASTRFPGKPLAILGGKTVIQRVYEQVSSVLKEAYVATDIPEFLFWIILLLDSMLRHAIN